MIVRIARRQVIVEGQSVGSIERSFERIEHDLRTTIEFLARFEILEKSAMSASHGRERDAYLLRSGGLPVLVVVVVLLFLILLG